MLQPDTSTEPPGPPGPGGLFFGDEGHSCTRPLAFGPSLLRRSAPLRSLCGRLPPPSSARRQGACSSHPIVYFPISGTFPPPRHSQFTIPHILRSQICTNRQNEYTTNTKAPALRRARGCGQGGRGRPSRHILARGPPAVKPGAGVFVELRHSPQRREQTSDGNSSSRVGRASGQIRSPLDDRDTPGEAGILG